MLFIIIRNNYSDARLEMCSSIVQLQPATRRRPCFSPVSAQTTKTSSRAPPTGSITTARSASSERTRGDFGDTRFRDFGDTILISPICPTTPLDGHELGFEPDWNLVLCPFNSEGGAVVSMSGVGRPPTPPSPARGGGIQRTETP